MTEFNLANPEALQNVEPSLIGKEVRCVFVERASKDMVNITITFLDGSTMSFVAFGLESFIIKDKAAPIPPTPTTQVLMADGGEPPDLDDLS